MQKKQTPDKYCEYCGQKLERKRLPNGDLEYLIHFNRRKYCNRECMKRAFLKTDESKQMWGAAHSTARKINQLILNKTECELCGKKTKLDIHHIDNNESNNNLNNLQALCRSCHMKAHRPKKICKVNGCNNYVKGHGYCEKHYQRWKKYGDPLISNRGHGHLVREQAGNGVTVDVVQAIAEKLKESETE